MYMGVVYVSCTDSNIRMYVHAYVCDCISTEKLLAYLHTMCVCDLTTSLVYVPT